MAFVRCYTGTDGQSHFEDLDLLPPDIERSIEQAASSTKQPTMNPVTHSHMPIWCSPSIVISESPTLSRRSTTSISLRLLANTRRLNSTSGRARSKQSLPCNAER